MIYSTPILREINNSDILDIIAHSSSGSRCKAGPSLVCSSSATCVGEQAHGCVSNTNWEV